MHLGGGRPGLPDVRRVHFDECFLNGKCRVRAVLEDPAVGTRPIPFDEVAILQAETVVDLARFKASVVAQAPRQRHAEHEQRQHRGTPSHGGASTLPFITLTPSPERWQGHAQDGKRQA